MTKYFKNLMSQFFTEASLLCKFVMKCSSANFPCLKKNVSEYIVVMITD